MITNRSIGILGAFEYHETIDDVDATYDYIIYVDRYGNTMVTKTSKDTKYQRYAVFSIKDKTPQEVIDMIRNDVSQIEFKFIHELNL